MDSDKRQEKKMSQDCPDCMENENAIGEGTRCARHEIEYLRERLVASEEKKIEALQDRNIFRDKLTESEAGLTERNADYREEYRAVCDANGRALKAEAALEALAGEKDASLRYANEAINNGLHRLAKGHIEDGLALTPASVTERQKAKDAVIEAARKRLAKGCNDTCSCMLNEDNDCDCGYTELEDALIALDSAKKGG